MTPPRRPVLHQTALADMPVSHETMAIHVDEFNRRMDALQAQQQSHERRFDRLDDRMDTLEASSHRQATASAKILEVVEGFEGGMRALELLARVVKPLAVVAAAVAGFVLWVKGGK